MKEITPFKDLSAAFGDDLICISSNIITGPTNIDKLLKSFGNSSLRKAILTVGNPPEEMENVTNFYLSFIPSKNITDLLEFSYQVNFKFDVGSISTIQFNTVHVNTKKVNSEFFIIFMIYLFRKRLHILGH